MQPWAIKPEEQIPDKAKGRMRIEIYENTMFWSQAGVTLT